MPLRSLSRSFLAASALLCIGGLAGAQTPMGLHDRIVPHRAVYDIKLARTEDGSGVSEAKGRLVFEITGSACEGYKMRQRMVVNISDEEGNLGLMDFRITTFESGNGDTYTFDSRTLMNDQVVEAVEGEARRSGSDIEVKLQQPSQKTIRLDGGALFPSQHLQAILDAARAKRKLVEARIYEGAGAGEASDAATAAIGNAVASGPGGPLQSGQHWPVSIGYFDGKDENATDFGEETPAYQMRFTLYENGVTNNLVMDYGKYALAGSLNQIEPLQVSDCSSP
jgi:hypothetical protein